MLVLLKIPSISLLEHFFPLFLDGSIGSRFIGVNAASLIFSKQRQRQRQDLLHFFFRFSKKRRGSRWDPSNAPQLFFSPFRLVWLLTRSYLLVESSSHRSCHLPTSQPTSRPASSSSSSSSSFSFCSSELADWEASAWRWIWPGNFLQSSSSIHPSLSACLAI